MNKNEKIKIIIENYKVLSKDIEKIDKRSLFLKKKKKDLEEVLISHFKDKKLENMNGILLTPNIRRTALSKTYLEKILKKYYRNYFLTNKNRLKNIDISKFSEKKSKELLNYIFKNRESVKYYRLKIKKS